MAFAFAPDLETARDCPFCGGDFLFFHAGAVACDQCQAEGPFTEHFDAHAPKDKAKRLAAVKAWNGRA